MQKLKKNPCNDESKTLNFVVTDEQDKTKQLPLPTAAVLEMGCVNTATTTTP